MTSLAALDDSSSRALDLINYWPLPAPSSAQTLFGLISAVISRSLAWRRITQTSTTPFPSPLVTLILHYVHDPGCSGRLVRRSLLSMRAAPVLGGFGSELLLSQGGDLSTVDLAVPTPATVRDLWHGHMPVPASDPPVPSPDEHDEHDGRVLAIAVTHGERTAAQQIVTLHRPGVLHYWSMDGQQHQRAVKLAREILDAATIAANPRNQYMAISFTAYAPLEIDDCLFQFDPTGAVSGAFDPQYRARQLCYMRSPHDEARDWLYSLNTDCALFVYDASPPYPQLLFRIGGLFRPSHTFVHSLSHATQQAVLALHSDVSADELASSKANRAAVAAQVCLTDTRLQAMACHRRRRQLYLFDSNSQRWLVTDARGSMLRWWREEGKEAEEQGEERDHGPKLAVNTADSQRRYSTTTAVDEPSPVAAPIVSASYDGPRHSLIVVQMLHAPIAADSQQRTLMLSYLC